MKQVKKKHVETTFTQKKNSSTHYILKEQFSDNKNINENNENYFLSEYNNFEITGEDSLNYAITGLQNKILKKLKKGFFKIEKTLDLHGMTWKQSEALLRIFFSSFLKNKSVILRCVLIVHGKGNTSTNKNPKIKPILNSWLKQNQNVFAFCSALQKHGGTGAVYVLIK